MSTKSVGCGRRSDELQVVDDVMYEEVILDHQKHTNDITGRETVIKGPLFGWRSANYEMGHGLHVEERAKRNLCSTWENPSGGSFLIENLNVQGQRDAALVNCRSQNMSRAQCQVT